MFQCQEVVGQAWLVTDMSQKCWIGKHFFYIYSVAMPLILFVGAFYTFTCIILKRTLKEGIVANYHKYLTAGFHSKCQGWELRIMMRKFVLVCLSLAYPKLDQFSHIVLFACVIGIAIHQDSKQLPYISLWLNLMNLFSHISIFAIVFVANAGDTSELTGVSCLGTLMVLIAGFAALKSLTPASSSKYGVPNRSSSNVLKVQPEGDSSMMVLFAPPASLLQV
jgi:hypothetical protein